MKEKLSVIDIEIMDPAGAEKTHSKAAKSQASLFLLEMLAANKESVVNAIASKAAQCLKMDKSRALQVLLEKIGTEQKKTVDGVVKRIGGGVKVNKSSLVPLLVLSVCLFSHSNGYCADAAESLDSVTQHVTALVFGSGIKKAVLGLAGAWGLFQAVSSGSFKPLLLWGGIGLAIAYVPKLIEVISNVG
jgi:hypothetical protein